MTIRKLNILSGIKTLICFSIFLSFGSVFSIFFPYILELLIAIFTGILMLISNNCNISVELLKKIVIILLIFLASMLLTQSSIIDYKILFVRVILVMFIITAFGNDYRVLKKYIVNALWLIIILALINYILVIIASSIFSLIESSDGYQVMTLYYIFNMFSEHSFMGFNIIRNQGIFWEPGILQIAANILIFSIILEDNKPILNAVLPIFIVLTTVSTTGFIVLAILLLVKFKKVFSFRGKGLMRTLSMVILISLFIPLLCGEIKHKFTGEAKTSSILRLFDFYTGLSVAIAHPIIGIGMNQTKMTKMTGDKIIEIDGKDLQSDRGNTNSIILMLVKLGFPITIISILALYNQSIFDHKFYLFIVLFFSLLSEPLYSSYVVLLFMISSIKNIKKI